MDAVTVQSANQAYRDELAEWMRFSDKEAASKLDGITADMIGLKGIVKTFLLLDDDTRKRKRRINLLNKELTRQKSTE